MFRDKEISSAVVNCEDINESSRTDLLDAYPDASLPVESLYTGNEHTHLKAAVDQLAEITEVDWGIISAEFGLASPETELLAYECTFSENDSVRERAKRMGWVQTR